MLTEQEILLLFSALNAELKVTGLQGELYLVGGAVMCLVHHARYATKDIDGYFVPAKELRAAAQRVAARRRVRADWLNDAVKGFLSECGDFQPFLELDQLRVYVALPSYLLAMKCLAARIGEEFHDLDDIQFLLRFLNLETYESALRILEQYYPIERFPQKTLYLLQELLPSER